MSTRVSPLSVSVVLNTFNRAGEMRRAIDSVLAQTFAEWELVIVDDGSTDGTAAFLDSLADPRISVVRHPNMGLTASRNAGARRANGTWLAFLDDDDTVEPDWLESVTGVVEADTGIVFCGHTKVEPSGRGSSVALPQPLGPAFLDQTGSFLPATWIMRRDVFEHAGGYLDGLMFIHQFELLLRAVRSCRQLGLRTAAVERPLLRYTVRPPHERPMLWPRLALDGGRWVLARHREIFATDRCSRADHEGVVGVAAARCGRLDLARRHLLRSLRAQPTDPRRWVRLGAALTASTARRVWGTSTDPVGRPAPLPLVHRLPAEHRRDPDHLFLPWGYHRNPQASSDHDGTPYWADPSRNDVLYQEPVYRRARRLMRQRSWRSVLDVGTGSGVKFERLVLPVAERAVGLDQGSGIELARSRSSAIEWIDGDLMDPTSWSSIGGHGFDLVICADVIEHVEDPVVLLRGLVDALGHDGRLLISTPDRLHFDRPTPLGPPGNPRHVREWTRDEFELLLESVGLQVEQQYRFLPRGYRPTVLELKRNVWRLLHLIPVPDRRSNMAFLCRSAPGDAAR